MVSTNIDNNGGNNNNFADILQYIGQWFVTTGDFITVVGQSIALEKDRQDQIQQQEEKKQQDEQQKQMQKQIEDMQKQIKLLQEKMK